MSDYPRTPRACFVSRGRQIKPALNVRDLVDLAVTGSAKVKTADLRKLAAERLNNAA